MGWRGQGDPCFLGIALGSGKSANKPKVLRNSIAGPHGGASEQSAPADKKSLPRRGSKGRFVRGRVKASALSLRKSKGCGVRNRGGKAPRHPEVRLQKPGENPCGQLRLEWQSQIWETGSKCGEKPPKDRKGKQEWRWADGGLTLRRPQQADETQGIKNRAGAEGREELGRNHTDGNSI